MEPARPCPLSSKTRINGPWSVHDGPITLVPAAAEGWMPTTRIARTPVEIKRRVGGVGSTDHLQMIA
jgi:hypothetical protein